ncbi:hypothetical protein AURDEDRAFT_158918 [Auricularia subglabra TFB-10046 SS5]|nr:hypothetical protein AURDEDRAFT_158918 [Auricularia subglabra TFB-10046 SS5]
MQYRPPGGVVWICALCALCTTTCIVGYLDGFPGAAQDRVSEGTWMRVDVHPKSGEMVFDMMGDIYCLAPPWTAAHPEAMSVRPHGAGDALLDALASREEDETLLASGVRETAERKERRLLREGCSQAYRVTNEMFRFVRDPRWHADGTRIVATKWYTGSRSLAAGEPWEYRVPSPPKKVKVGAGKLVLGRTLPPGWSAEEYNEEQIGQEQAIWAGGDAIIYSKNVIDTNSAFEYNRNVHSGIYAIFPHNLTSGATKMLVSKSRGGASRPELSRDGRRLAFVRRVRDKEALILVYARPLGHLLKPGQLDPAQIEAQIGSGFVEVKDIQLDDDAINEFLSDLPVRLVTGVVGTVTARVPWPNILSATFALSLSSVHLVFAVAPPRPKHTRNLTESVALVAEEFVHEELTPEENILASFRTNALPGGLWVAWFAKRGGTYRGPGSRENGGIPQTSPPNPGNGPQLKVCVAHQAGAARADVFPADVLVAEGWILDAVDEWARQCTTPENSQFSA